ncbi:MULTISPECIES: hypothetical protein [Paracoccus]|uniref:hypothetical protein n=1 Tax=Paracoccus TaxID=265 RepID=UPI00086CB477|nr:MULTISPECIES: hypothetical protein [Paracoccus]ODT58794.1 MAG: hypothetical protein ABS73_11920 [Paracoccus sp. SCN 68-21]
MVKARRTSATDAADPAQPPVLTVIEGTKPRRTRKAAAAPEAPAAKAPRARTAKPKAAPRAEDAPPKPAAKPRSRSKAAPKARDVTKPARQTRARAAKPAPASDARWVDELTFAAQAQAQAGRSVAQIVLSEDQPLGAAAREIARIRSEMQQIRHMIDSQPVEQGDAHAMLQRLCRNPAPRGLLAGSTASVIELVPQTRRASAPAARALRAVPDAIAAPLPDAIADTVAPQISPVIANPDPVLAQLVAPVAMPAPVRAPSRIARLLSAWGDWLMWRLLPPALPSQASAARPGATPQPLRQAAAASVAQVAPADSAPVGRGPVAPMPPQPPVPMDEIVGQAVTRIMEDGSLRAHLKEMIREELEGEMGARFSGNLRAVVRREIATALDERLTHL